MNLIETMHQQLQPVLLGCDIPRHMAFDGCDYFFTIACRDEIIKTDCDGHELCRFPTRRLYNCICYDFCAGCFWASDAECPQYIYKLDCGFDEIDRIPAACYGRLGNITGLSYNCCDNALLVSYGGLVIKQDKCTHDYTEVYCPKRGYITGILALCPYLLVTLCHENQQYVAVIDDCGRLIARLDVPSGMVLQNLVFRPTECGDTLTALVIKAGCYPYLYQLRLCYGELGLHPAPCNYELPCHCCHPIPPIPPHPVDPCNDLIESIALVEAALSHILNAEGEKLQKVLATTDDLDTILLTNREINRTIVSATHLEQILYAKLTACQDGSICPKPPHPPNPPHPPKPDPCDPCEPCDEPCD